MKPYIIKVRGCKTRYYCGKCQMRIYRNYKVCSNCKTEIEWKNIKEKEKR